MLLMRISQFPQSSLDQLYIDELGLNGKEASGLSYEELAQRYVDYKRTKDAPLTGWAYSEEGRKKVDKKYMKKFEELYKERLESLSDEEVEQRMADGDKREKEVLVKKFQERVDALDSAELTEQFPLVYDAALRRMMSKRIAKDAGASKDPYGIKTNKVWELTYQQMSTAEDVREDALLLKAQEDAKDHGDEIRSKQVSLMRSSIHALTRDLGVDDERDSTTMERIRTERRKLMQELGIEGVSE